VSTPSHPPIAGSTKLVSSAHSFSGARRSCAAAKHERIVQKGRLTRSDFGEPPARPGDPSLDIGFGPGWAGRPLPFSLLKPKCGAPVYVQDGFLVQSPCRAEAIYRDPGGDMLPKFQVRKMRLSVRNQRPRLAFAVGTRIAECPPHRSERAQFGHSAPTSGV
jgi:hypothetical protein